MRSGTTWTYFLTDHLGSVVATTDSAGAVLAQTRYTELGEVRTDVGSVTQTDFGFTFQRNIADMGLMDYKARFYSSYMNRWIQPDSIVTEPGSTQGFNRYSYVGNNPINYNDPSGNMPVEGCGEDGKYACHASDMEVAENAQKLAFLEYDPSGQKQARNAEIAEKTLEGVETLATVLFEPLDWMSMGEDCITGDCSYWYSLALLPIIPGKLARLADDLPGLKKVELPHWPSSVEEMNEILGVVGEKIPDLPSTPGRNKVVWNLSDNLKIIFEQHPYHIGAPELHAGPHWHISWPGSEHLRFISGDPMP
jgi:RHS repeat-associated protein